MSTLVTIREMARRKGISSKTLRRIIKQNQIPYERIGRQIRLDPARFNFTTLDAGEAQNVVTFSPSKKGVRSAFAEGL